MAAQARVLQDEGILAEVPAWLRSLQARGRTDTTLATYESGVQALARYLREQGMPLTLEGIRREHVEAFVIDLLQRRKAGTAGTRFRACQQFFKWAVDEGLITRSPMERMKHPSLPEQPVEVLTDEEVQRLLKVCSGTDFVSRRDTALIRILLSTGCRRTEVISLQVEDVDRGRLPAITVMGKGRRSRTIP
jgi:site-specific recombinase XerD